jgi:putative FmdB family regulatory protein
MPTYDYECTKCGHRFEKFQSMSDPVLKTCPKCKGKVQRLIGPGAGLLFKGEGFYITDYRSKGYQEKAKSEKSGEGSASGASGSSEGGASGSGSSADSGGAGAGATGSGERSTRPADRGTGSGSKADKPAGKGAAKSPSGANRGRSGSTGKSSN